MKKATPHKCCCKPAEAPAQGPSQSNLEKLFQQAFPSGTLSERHVEDLVRQAFVRMMPAQQADAGVSGPDVPPPSRCVAGPCTAKQDRGAMNEQLDRLDMACTMLQDGITELEKGLDPFLRPGPEATETCEPNPVGDSPITNFIAAKASRLLGQAERILALRRRIDLS